MRRDTKCASDKAQIGTLLDAYTAAIRAKDANATVGLYARDVVAYDLAPPLAIKPSRCAARITSSSGSTPGKGPYGPHRRK